jgi:hypothetical protein
MSGKNNYALAVFKQDKYIPPAMVEYLRRKMGKIDKIEISFPKDLPK